MSEEQVNSLKEQAASFRMKKIRKEAQIRVEEEILEQWLASQQLLNLSCLIH